MSDTTLHTLTSRMDALSSHSTAPQERTAGQAADHGASLSNLFGNSIRIQRGSRSDYLALASFHYKGAHPGAITSVFSAVHEAPTVIGRYLAREAERCVIGVLVRSLPHLGCSLRDRATHGRYRGLGGKASASLINREVRTISRVVIDPRWRGVGLAVQLVKHALLQPETVFTEALAAMGHVHPFFERAGMQRYERPPRPEHARMIDALSHAQLAVHKLASMSITMTCVERMTIEMQAWLSNELRRWHRAAFRTSPAALRAMTIESLLREARDHLLINPVYYLIDHRTRNEPHASHRSPAS